MYIRCLENIFAQFEINDIQIQAKIYLDLGSLNIFIR